MPYNFTIEIAVQNDTEMVLWIHSINDTGISINIDITLSQAKQFRELLRTLFNDRFCGLKNRLDPVRLAERNHFTIYDEKNSNNYIKVETTDIECDDGEARVKLENNNNLTVILNMCNDDILSMIREFDAGIEETYNFYAIRAKQYAS